MTSPESRRVMISGAAGFLGGYVARHFAGLGWEVIGLDQAPRPCGQEWTAWHQLTLPDSEFRAILRARSPEVFVHCAGRASVADSVRDPAADFEGSAALTFAVLDDLRREAPGVRFLFTSSAAIYGNPESLPVAEEAAVAPLSPYGFHKRQCEELCREFAVVYGLSTASARIFSAYGPGLRRQVMWDICAKALGPERLRLQGTGRESRDFIHAADIARGLCCLAENGPLTGETYNLASGSEVTIATLADRLLRALGVEKAIEFDGVVPAGNPLNWRADIRRIALLGFRPEMDSDTEIGKFARWAKRELAGA